MRFVRAAATDELAEGALLRVEVEGRAVALARVDGGIYAVADGCTHEAASLANGFVEGHVIECPRHGARFDLRDGRVLSLPALLDLASYPVRIEGGSILVGIVEEARASGGVR